MKTDVRSQLKDYWQVVYDATPDVVEADLREPRPIALVSSERSLRLGPVWVAVVAAVSVAATSFCVSVSIGSAGCNGMLCTNANMATRHSDKIAMKRIMSVCRSAAPPASMSAERFSG